MANIEEKQADASSPGESGRIDGVAGRYAFEANAAEIPDHATHDGAEEYDERAAKLWSVYVEEAESHDKALIETWKDDMEAIIIFAGLYSASLTAFLAQSYQNLQPDPAQESFLLMQQSVTLLYQISRQLGPNGSQVEVLPPSPAPPFSPSSSDVRVNVLWFMSLVFSLTAALAATIVQSWVRDYMHVFQRYSHSLKRARIRHFRYEGLQDWYMNVVVDGIPALIHISLFLFFVGLADFLFHINSTTAITTTITIALAAALYLWTVVAPIFDAKSPYQSPLSGVFWLLFQIVRRREHKDKSTGGEPRRVSTDMTEGRVQLAMDQSTNRLERDARAICWVLENLTEDSELEPFVFGIPGSLNTAWGQKVWATVGKNQISSAEDSLGVHQTDVIGDLSGRISRLLKTCADPGILSTEEARRKRARACINAVLSLILSMESKWEWFAEGEVMSQALIYLGDAEKVREPVPGFDGLFAVRWTCMALMATRKMLQTDRVKAAANNVVKKFAEARSEKRGDDDEVAAKTTGILDRCVKSAWESADALHFRFKKDIAEDKMEEEFHNIMREYKGELAELEYSWNLVGWADGSDDALSELAATIMHATGGILGYLSGSIMPWPQDTRRGPSSGMRPVPPTSLPHFLPARLLTQRLWLCAWALRNLAASGWSNNVYQPKKFIDLSAPEMDVADVRRLMDTAAPFRTQLWRLQDLRDGGMIYAVELLINAIRSNKHASHQSSLPLYVGTLKHLIADWALFRRSGTQNALVALLRDVLENPPGEELPGPIIDEVLKLVGNMLAGQKGPHVSSALALIRNYASGALVGADMVAQEVLLKLAPPKRTQANHAPSQG